MKTLVVQFTGLVTLPRRGLFLPLSPRTIVYHRTCYSDAHLTPVGDWKVDTSPRCLMWHPSDSRQIDGSLSANFWEGKPSCAACLPISLSSDHFLATSGTPAA